MESVRYYDELVKNDASIFFMPISGSAKIFFNLISGNATGSTINLRDDYARKINAR